MAKGEKKKEPANKPVNCSLPGWERVKAGEEPSEVSKHPGGRPTIYRDSFCEVVIECGKKGFSKAMMAAELDVVRSTLDEWCKGNKKFSDAMQRARELSLAWWESEGMSGIWGGKEFNAQAYRLQLCNRFPADYRPETAITNKDKGDGDQLEDLKNIIKTGASEL